MPNQYTCEHPEIKETPLKILMTGNNAGLRQEDMPMVRELRDKHPEVTFVEAGNLQEQVEQIRDCDVLYGWPDREVYLAGERLKWVHCPGTGVDQLTEIPELVESDVVVTNARGPHAPPMADHTLGLIIGLAHRMHEQRDDQRACVWDKRKYPDTFAELAGSTMGILSLGDIGSEVAKRAFGFDMDVYAVDLHLRPAPPTVKKVWGLDRLDDLLAMSDWFVVTAPLTVDTAGMVDRRRLGLLKDGARVIIISRGGIVDEEALADELASGRLGGAGIDAFSVEPLPQDSRFWDLPNVIISPHSSAHTPEMTVGRRRIFAENLRRYLANEPFLYVVDKKAGF